MRIDGALDDREAQARGELVFRLVPDKVSVRFFDEALVSIGRSTVPSRASSAAYARAASISAAVSAGQLRRISPRGTPAATLSITAETVVRVPRTHARPWQTAGFTLIRSRQFCMFLS